ncbi:hypothetical protein SAMN05444673_7016 [Bacillus sp. OV166]|uniref:CBO0543 family protein n=1 Tax=Bacillus sp. OV166 TaxID=1882763 RepID=UPI000A2AC23A|nr:CBO0543 family protein [Bacillus sp. OV166]SMQ86934.1 hypothetical protein SAMN05444673_7016 [Bacillus sp. OV166]
MFFNIILVFVIPWIVGLLHLYKQDKVLIPVIGSFFSVIAFTINEFGFYFGFWEVLPSFNQKTLSALPFNLGLYPILASYLIYFIKKYKYPYLVLLLMTIFTTLIEMIFSYFGRVIYSNGWNNIWTFCSYMFPYILVYWFYTYLKKLKILK